MPSLDFVRTSLLRDRVIEEISETLKSKPSVLRLFLRVDDNRHMPPPISPPQTRWASAGCGRTFMAFISRNAGPERKFFDKSCLWSENPLCCGPGLLLAAGLSYLPSFDVQSALGGSARQPDRFDNGAAARASTRFEKISIPNLGWLEERKRFSEDCESSQRAMTFSLSL